MKIEITELDDELVTILFNFLPIYVKLFTDACILGLPAFLLAPNS